ncbi:MAG: hypothetical protein V1914_04445 [archaeon]
MPTALGSAIEFLEEFGFFDVILPFLLVFTIVFGILEKTRIFGVEKVGEKEYPKKGINSMIAFVIAFFVVAAREVVASIQVSIPQVVLVLLLLISFMLLVGVFMGDKQFNLEDKHKWVAFLMVVIFLLVIMIFINSFGWLQPVIDYFMESTYLLVPLIFLIVIIIAVMYVVGGKPKEKSE